MKGIRRAGLSLLVGCAQLAGGDGGLRDDGGDGAALGWDATVCVAPRPDLYVYQTCAEAKTVCQQWAQIAAVNAYGFSQCATNPVTGNLYCNDPGCSGQCASGQVCASTTPTGPRQCIEACASGGSALDSGAYDVTLPDGFDPANCDTESVTFGGACTDATEQLCEVWTRDRAYGAIGHGLCQTLGGGALCTLGDYCPSPGQECQCSPR